MLFAAIVFLFYLAMSALVVTTFFACLIRYTDLWKACDPETWIMRWFCKKHNFIYACLQKQNHPELYARD